MTIFAFQHRIKDAINTCETLVQGRCRAFAEDTRTVYDEAEQWMSGGGIALVVVTPRLTRNGCRADGVPCDCRLMVRCMELPPVASSNPNAIRALDAAETVAHALDSEAFQFQDIEQAVSTNRSGNTVVTATVTFATTILLTND